jgi:uncharacterized protein YraI
MLRNVLIHAVVALAALAAAVLANPAYAVMPVSVGAGEGAAYPGWAIVVYPEGEVLVFAPADAGND